MNNENRLLGLKIKHLRLVDSINKYGSLRKAAENIHLSEPAASHLLKDVERIFERQLFSRLKTGLVSNEYGEILINKTKSILHELSLLAIDFDGIENSNNRLITIGAIPRCLNFLIPSALANFYKKDFTNKIKIIEATSSELFELIKNREIDIALARPEAVANQEEYNIEILHREGLSVICSKENKISDKVIGSLQSLCEEQWVLPPSTSLHRILFDKEFINNGLKPIEPILEWSISSSRLNLVEQSNFLSICSESLAKSMCASKNLRIVPVDIKGRPSPIAIITNKVNRKDNYIDALKNEIINVSMSFDIKNKF